MKIFKQTKNSNNVLYMLTGFLEEPYNELESWVREEKFRGFDEESYKEHINEWCDHKSNNWFPISSFLIYDTCPVWISLESLFLRVVIRQGGGEIPDLR